MAEEVLVGVERCTLTAMGLTSNDGNEVLEVHLGAARSGTDAAKAQVLELVSLEHVSRLLREGALA